MDTTPADNGPEGSTAKPVQESKCNSSCVLQVSCLDVVISDVTVMSVCLVSASCVLA